ncbi:MAG: diguanylate cyclase [Spirochaetes bacterium]|nr:diguanylate cyclase [Spirochaetota bacterium]
MNIDEYTQSLLDSLNDGIYILDKNRKILFWNKAAESITGFTADEVIGKSCSENILRHIDMEGKQLCHYSCPMLLSINNAQTVETDVYLHHKEGYRLLVHVKGIPWYANGAQIGAIEIFYPMLFLQQKIKQDLVKLALIDPLTGVFNRRGFESIYYPRYLEMKVSKPSTAILFFDVDNFKKLNDIYGHDCGDAVLKTVAHTLLHNVRTYDIVARWGGEEFIVVLFIESHQSAVTIATKLCTLIANAFLEYNGTTVTVTASCGATLLHENEHITTAISRADTLMYTAKKNGKNQVYHDIT